MPHHPPPLSLGLKHGPTTSQKAPSAPTRPGLGFSRSPRRGQQHGPTYREPELAAPLLNGGNSQGNTPSAETCTSNGLQRPGFAGATGPSPLTLRRRTNSCGSRGRTSGHPTLRRVHAAAPSLTTTSRAVPHRTSLLYHTSPQAISPSKSSTHKTQHLDWTGSHTRCSTMDSGLPFSCLGKPSMLELLARYR